MDVIRELFDDVSDEYFDNSVSSELQALLEQEKAQDEEQVLSLYQEAQNVMGVCC